MEVLNSYPSPEDILREVRSFVKGTGQERPAGNIDITKSALFLLRTLPSARHAVMEHLCNVFDEAVKYHVLQREMNKEIPENADFEAVIEDISGMIMEFIKSNPEAWAPIISAWAVELLGRISSKYADRGGVPHSSLNDVLQLWMTCPATKALIDLASQCFSSMVGNTPDSSVDALLEASVRHSPHFDWVVAHIGSCFPTTIITRVLLCGLKDFCVHGKSGAPHGGQHGGPYGERGRREPKIGSVVSILGHLATRHGRDIRLSIIKLFKESLDSPDDMLQSVVPFLLHLASLSPMLLNIMCKDFVQTVTPDVLNRLASQLAGKPNRTLDGSSLMDVTVFLIIQCAKNSHQILKFLLQTAYPSTLAANAMETDQTVSPVVKETARIIMDKVLADLEKIVHTRKPGPAQVSPFLRDLQNHNMTLAKLMLQCDKASEEWLRRLLTCIGLQSSEPQCADFLCAILSSNSQADKMMSFVQILTTIQPKFPNVLAATITLCMQQLSADHEKNDHLLQSLLHLLKWQKSNNKSPWMGLQVERHLLENLEPLAGVLNTRDAVTAAVAMEILVCLNIPSNTDVSKTVLLTHSVIAYFFRSMHSTDISEKMQSCTLGRKLLVSMCHLPAIQKTVIRLLVEETLSQRNAILFGAKLPQSLRKPESQLLVDDMKQDQSIANLRLKMGTLFHGGIIGHGLRPPPRANPVSKDQQAQNKSLLLETLWAVCQTPVTGEESRTPGVMSPKLALHLALLLVEVITPDVMYNGIPWLDEEFCKVTIERDLQIRSKMDDNPILWDIMEIAAAGSMALCYCSAVLRAVTSTLITFWESCRDKVTSNCPKQLQTTCRVIQLMRQGSLLPEPLCYIDEVLPYLPPFETAVILHDVWLFMHEKPPVPDEVENALRKCDPKKYLEAIRNVMLSHIDRVGHLFPHFFPSENPS